MNILLIIAAALLPAVLLWRYVWKQDPQPEPKEWLRKAVIYGVVICFPVAAVEGVIMGAFGDEVTSYFGAIMEAFFVAALPEESFKLLALWLVLRHNPFFDEHYDGIVYAVCVGLGFAAVENVGYLLASGEEWQAVAISRALLAVPGHYAFAVLMGYYYSVYHFTDHSPRAAACVLLVPVFAHGVYDALALSGKVNPFIGGFCLLVLIVFCVQMHKFARKKIIAQIERDKAGKDHTQEETSTVV